MTDNRPRDGETCPECGERLPLDRVCLCCTYRPAAPSEPPAEIPHHNPAGGLAIRLERPMTLPPAEAQQDDERPPTDEERAAADELTQISEDMGLYDERQGRRLAVDADGYVWWVNADDSWSMARINPDNSPIPQPVTYYEPTRQSDEFRAGYAAAVAALAARPSADTETLRRVRELLNRTLADYPDSIQHIATVNALDLRAVLEARK